MAMESHKEDVCLAPMVSGIREIDKSMKKHERKYYQRQNDMIKTLVNLHEDIHEEEEAEAPGRFSCLRTSNQASILSLSVNIILLIIKAVAAAASGSMSIISTLVDSVLDLFSGTVFYLVGRNVARRDRRYPVGKTRLEPIAVVFVASVMGTAALEVILLSVQSLAQGPSMPDLTVTSFAIMGAVIGLKSLLFVMCRSLNTPTSQALSTDHLNDVVSNSVVLAAVLIAKNVSVYADDVGAIIVSLFIIRSWWRQGMFYARTLIGRASAELVQQVTWLAMHHDVNILAVDTVRTYSMGTGYFVECDIVLNPNTPLRYSHDIGESLQVRLERLEDVERVFVHIDYSSDHTSRDEHRDPYETTSKQESQPVTSHEIVGPENHLTPAFTTPDDIISKVTYV